MTEMILLKLGELVLKGANRHTFEDKLKSNIARRLRPLGKFRVYTRQSTTYVEPLSDTCDMDAAYEAMKHVFGVVGISRAKACEKTREAMLETARSYLGDKLSAAHTFKVESKRAGSWTTSIPTCRWTSTSRSSPSTWRCGITPPSSMPTRSRGRAACRWGPAGGRSVCSPAALTPRWPPG